MRKKYFIIHFAMEILGISTKAAFHFWSKRRKRKNFVVNLVEIFCFSGKFFEKIR